MHDTLAYYISVLRKDFTIFCNERLIDLGISQGLLYFIIYIGKNPNCSPTELSNKLKLDSGHTTRSIDKLVKSEFIVKEKNINDKRSSVLNLTEKGKNVFQESYKMFYSWDNKVLKNISEEEENILIKVISKIALEKNNNC
ncbi:MAG: bilirubin utilization transcriptional regulator BilQ [Peptostreptococcaceae bacterium]